MHGGCNPFFLMPSSAVRLVTWNNDGNLFKNLCVMPESLRR